MLLFEYQYLNENDLGSNNTHRSTKASSRIAYSTVCAEQSTPVGFNGRLYIPRFSAIFGCFAYTLPPLALSRHHDPPIQ
jgi:hypothetical protein